MSRFGKQVRVLLFGSTRLLGLREFDGLQQLDSGRGAFIPSDGGSQEFIVTVIRASVSSNPVLPRQLVLLQQFVLVMIGLLYCCTCLQAPRFFPGLSGRLRTQ